MWSSSSLGLRLTYKSMSNEIENNIGNQIYEIQTHWRLLEHLGPCHGNPARFAMRPDLQEKFAINSQLYACYLNPHYTEETPTEFGKLHNLNLCTFFPNFCFVRICISCTVAVLKRDISSL